MDSDVEVLVGRTRRRAAMQARVEAAGRRARARRWTDDVRRRPVGWIPVRFWPAPHPAFAVMEGYEYRVLDRHGGVVMYERGPDYVVPWALYAMVAFSQPRPLPPAVRRGAVRWRGSVRRPGRPPLWPA